MRNKNSIANPFLNETSTPINRIKCKPIETVKTQFKAAICKEAANQDMEAVSKIQLWADYQEVI